jgi:outer membrane protein
LKQPFYRKNWLTLTIASALAYSGPALAEGAADGTDPSSYDNSGFTALSNATNVTHWGLGAGAAIQASPYRGDGAQFNPIPLIFFDNKWVHAFGSTIDLKIGTWDGLSFAFRGDFALGDGYKQSDAPILNGMQNRNGAFWYGPALAWRTELGTLSADYLLGGNKGEPSWISANHSLLANFQSSRMLVSNG